jgi:DNA-binding response OmpR family regulator
VTRRARIGQREVTLSAREFALLAYLMRHPGQVLSRQQILNGVWGYTFDPRSNLVDVYVGYLRRKLADCDRPIETVRSMGYRLAARRAE